MRVDLLLDTQLSKRVELYWRDELFQTELFTQLAASMVRLLVASLYVDQEHPVIRDESVILSDLVSKIKVRLRHWQPRLDTLKSDMHLAVTEFILHRAADEIQFHLSDGMDESVACALVVSVCSIDLGELFPGEWLSN